MIFFRDSEKLSIGMIQNAVCFLTLNFLLVTFGTAAPRGYCVGLRCSDDAAAPTKTDSRIHLFDVPLDSPMKCEISKELPCLVQFARGMTGKIDITSVYGSSGSIEPTRSDRNPRDSSKVVDCTYVSLGQNTRNAGYPDAIAGQKRSGYEPCCRSYLTRESPTSNPLSFAWKYIETKK